MDEFKKAFGRLNSRQREAVDQIYGPVLVIAGPGTGKTQLISTRAGYILDKTDTAPNEILCLTFTNAGVAEMRERLISLIGQDAYAINIYTYHAFGSEIIYRHPEYFDDEQLEQIEELRQDLLLREIISRLPYSSPLKYADSYLNDVKSFIKDAKAALLEPKDIKAAAESNLEAIDNLNQQTKEILAKIPSISPKNVGALQRVLGVIRRQKTVLKLPDNLKSISIYAGDELESALADFAASGKTSSLTKWKSSWLEKDEAGNFIFKGAGVNQKIIAAATIYQTYQDELKSRRLYDYEDMILRAIRALETHPELKYSLAENYQFLMLDEFQDTNRAQMRLVELLTDHPVHEGRPNVLAVGDDDQAIYTFQGADQANMYRFSRLYKDVRIINLAENYRAHTELIDLAQAVAGQIEERLHHNFKGLKKELVAASKLLSTPPTIELREFRSDAAEMAWLAKQIKELTKKQAIPANELAVLAPKHRYLLALLPYLAAEGVSVRYEKRENVLDEPIIRQLTQMSRLVLALRAGDDHLANELWSEVLSYDFWGLPTEEIWRLSWQAGSNHQPWTKVLLDDNRTAKIARFFLRLSDCLSSAGLELILDALIGLPEASRQLKTGWNSPLFSHYFSSRASKDQPHQFVQLVNSLSLLRSRLWDWSRNEDRPLGLSSFVEFVEGHRQAGINILNESPYAQSPEAVNLMTAYGAKGREFRAVFVIAAQDEVWGSTSRSASQRISLPANLKFIRYQGMSEDERLRLFFVALTRARTHLYISRHAQTLAGKNTSRLKYLDFSESSGGTVTSRVVPAKFAKLIKDNNPGIEADVVENYWASRHLPPLRSSLRVVLRPQLERYQLSPTHLNQFIDLEHGGPDQYFLKCLLGFPEAPNQTTIYGTAVHDSLKWLGGRLARGRKLASEKQLLDYFGRQLALKRLPAEQFALLLDRGKASLSVWLKQSGAELTARDFYEYDFKDEAVLIGKVRLAGKVDRLIIDEKNKSITVLDYKTGQAYKKWQGSVTKLHKFRQQLMLYKLLVEGSSRFKGYRVKRGIIEFVEPDAEGNIIKLELNYTDDEVEQLKKLATSIWNHIQRLDFPNTSKYQPTLSGIKVFEKQLISEVS